MSNAGAENLNKSTRGEIQTASASWDAEYRAGRYATEDPVPFVQDIITAARTDKLLNGQGLYIGCGNGRNYLPLAQAGLDLTGLDISRQALQQLAERAPEHRERLVHGDLTALPADDTFDVLVGIQVFQHGDRATVHTALHQAQQKLKLGGLFCLRVNAVGTDVWPDHELTEQNPDGGFTIRYLAGPKTGLLIHFFGETELATLFGSNFQSVLPLRLDHTYRSPPQPGRWSQWEAIWRKTAN